VEDRDVEAGHLREVGIGMKWVLVAREAIEERLVRDRRRLDDRVRRPAGRLVAGLRARLAAEAALAAREDREAVREQRLAALEAARHLEHDEGRLALVV